MKKKTYTNPVSIVVTIPPMVLLNSSPTTSIPYDPDGITEEALAPMMNMDGHLFE